MIIVIGAGASGMVAAIEAAKSGGKVMIIERGDKPGKKIYATGNGKCNLTNTHMDIECFRGTDKDFIRRQIEKFGYEDTMEYFRNLGLMFKNKNGYIYPASGQASSVVEALSYRCYLDDIKILCNVECEGVKKLKSGYEVITSEGNFKCDKVILSTGTNAGINKGKLPKKTGYDIVKDFGVKVSKIVPSLTGIKCKNQKFFKSCQGVRCDGEIEILTDGKVESADFGELQITDYGISGIPTFQVCRYAGFALLDKKNVRVRIDFARDLSEDEIRANVLNKYMLNKNLRIIQCFNGIINDKLAKAIIEFCGYDMQMKLQKVKEEEIIRMVTLIKHFEDEVIGINDMQNAQVAAGGILLDELTDDFELKRCKGFYVTGEVLDADGICGGYNLQWAFTSGYIAGNDAGKGQK